MGQTDVIHLIALIVSAAGIIGTVIWRTGNLAWKLGSLDTTVKGLRSWLHDLKAGDSPVCARHGQQLANHDHRIGRLEGDSQSAPDIIPMRRPTDERQD